MQKGYKDFKGAEISTNECQFGKVIETSCPKKLRKSRKKRIHIKGNLKNGMLKTTKF